MRVPNYTIGLSPIAISYILVKNAVCIQNWSFTVLGDGVRGVAKNEWVQGTASVAAGLAALCLIALPFVSRHSYTRFKNSFNSIEKLRWIFDVWHANWAERAGPGLRVTSAVTGRHWATEAGAGTWAWAWATSTSSSLLVASKALKMTVIN